MNLNDYGQKALMTMTTDHAFGDISPKLISLVLGLVGESGEVADKFKKIMRDDQGIISEEIKLEILKELGDVLWYINAIASELGSDIETVAQVNIEKLASRKIRSVISGSGDNR